ncbi:hypothetical protein ACFO3D_13575 [Virgibacillus kekensis]|uniref:Uncharacterized protein n=1 Tax=Virgibacillus kekensis TaxID=202261 RepID=A0ABV9DMB3_9BACI
MLEGQPVDQEGPCRVDKYLVRLNKPQDEDTVHQWTWEISLTQNGAGSFIGYAKEIGDYSDEKIKPIGFFADSHTKALNEMVEKCREKMNI